MSQSNDILESSLVAVDGLYLSIINDRVQDISNDAESLSMGLSTIKIKDDTSKGIIVGIRSTLLENNELARIVSEMIDGLITLPTVEVKGHE
ncbi:MULTISPECIES: hypothetical protein [unclassified Psychrobacter]|uniref:hypothetical protein n=1 Tax=unclassified Psychrobacter TaxID=196806 RepID=UPI000EBEED0B|nr:MULTISPECIES: hypothetical protein [unclassified Psychrobacter]MBE8609357.1 hypothetical protein [Pseudomonas lundensis]HCI74845.1 hypothetical protein [Psychrobacter sp.]